MNDLSIQTPQLPGLRRLWSGADLARDTLFKVIARLQTGSVILYEGDKTYRFGNPDAVGEPHAEIRINNPLAYSGVLLGGAVGAGESYIEGHWSSPELVDVVRLFTANMSMLQSMDALKAPLRSMAMRLLHLMKRNTRDGSQRNISAHYDLGNDFFDLFLDRNMMYSAAIFPHQDASLEEASDYKLDRICQQLELSANDHLVEIGTGWGGMALYAATHYGCRVTTTTISREQYQHARQRVIEAGLEDRVEVLCKDYRELEGHYDKLVSIEMIEAVGHSYYSNYFRACSALLKPGGLMLIQAITIADQRYETARRSVDFIQRYIFPGGCLPSIAVISAHVATDTDMQIVDLHDMTEDYANTLAHWRSRFRQRIEEVRAQGFDERFENMWEYYLCYCEGGFRERVIGTVQVTMAKPAWRRIPG